MATKEPLHRLKKNRGFQKGPPCSGEHLLIDKTGSLGYLSNIKEKANANNENDSITTIPTKDLPNRLGCFAIDWIAAATTFPWNTEDPNRAKPVDRPMKIAERGVRVSAKMAARINTIKIDPKSPCEDGRTAKEMYLACPSSVRRRPRPGPPRNGPG